MEHPNSLPIVLKIMSTSKAAIAATAVSRSITANDIDMSLPTASVVPTAQEHQAVSSQVTFAQLKDYLPHLSTEDLLDMLDAVNTLIRKRIRGKGKSKSAMTVPGIKKPAPPTLALNQGWIRFVQEYVSNNGWESFEINQTTDGVKELIERSGSIPNDQQPRYTYKDTKTGEEITPEFIFEDTKKHLIYKEAMSLGAILKWQDGKKPAKAEDEEANWSDLYRTFLESHQEKVVSGDVASESSSTSSTPSTTSVRRLTASEREQERLEKQRIKDEVKAEKQREKEAEKARKAAEKEAEKVRKAEEKEAEKARKAAEKVKKVSTPPALPALPALPAIPAIPAIPARPAIPAAAKAASSVAAPAKKTILAKPTVPKKPEPEVMKWNIPDDGMIHPWTFQGKRYVVNAQYCCWEATDDDEAGDWVGMVIPEKNRIDDSVEEPEYDEDMEEEE